MTILWMKAAASVLLGKTLDWGGRKSDDLIIAETVLICFAVVCASPPLWPVCWVASAVTSVLFMIHPVGTKIRLHHQIVRLRSEIDSLEHVKR